MFDHRTTRPSYWIGVVALVLALACGGLPFTSPPSAEAAAPRLAVGHLTTDSAADPLGIDDARPSLGWTLRSALNDQRQGGYRVLVASSEARLDRGEADVWDSGRAAGQQSSGIEYGGPPPQSAHRYYWKVRVWDAQGRPSAWSSTAWWETGLLNPGDWSGAQWISPDTGSALSWSDFTLDTDFTVKAGAASVLFRAKDARDYYMWQVNTVTTPGKVTLRPHVQADGTFTTLGEVDLSSVITESNASSPHHMRITADGPRITTWIDGREVDSRTDDTLTQGTIGFRTSTSAGVAEDALYDNVEVTGPDGTTLFGDDFSASADPRFPGSAVTDGQLEPEGDPVLLDPDPDAPMLRKSFTLNKPVASARAYVYGLGSYEMHLNGQKVGDHVLAPGSAPYDRRDPYATYDVTRQLHRGANAVGMWLGNGYGPRFSPYGFRWTGPKQAVMLLTVTYTDGTRQSITTDDTWKWSSGAITSNDLYAGESYDARLDQPGWDTAGFAGGDWQPVRTVAAPVGDLVADTAPPVRVTGSLRPVALLEPRPGVYVYDFGQNIAGLPRLRVRGPAGTTVRMRTAEETGEDGMLDTTTNRAAASTDTYTLAGTGGTETYEPRFTYHGFRYVELTGYPGTPTTNSLDARAIHADVASTATFTSSDTLLNRIWSNNRWSILNNSMSLPTDNPVRDERTPPGMDVQAYHDASVSEFGMDRFYANYLQDMPPGTALPNDAANAQQPDMGGDQISLAWTLYEQYGDRATLAAAYPAMKAFVDTNATDVPGHIWPDDRGFGDWCPPDHGAHANGGMGDASAGSCTSEVSLVNTALSYLQAQDVAKAAQALGHPDEAGRYRRLAASIEDAFNAHFLNAAGDTYGDGRQVTSVLPLAFGMVPAKNLRAVGAQFADTVLHKDADHLDTGIFGTRYLMDALSAIGRTDIALSVLDEKTYPGFGFEIAQGATSPWEEWTYRSSMETHDHAMFAGINASFTSLLGGISPASPGYGTVVIAPQAPAGLRHAAASVDTVHGTVSTSWTRTGGRFDLTVTVPVGVTATVHVPRSGRTAPATATRGARTVRRDAAEVLYTVRSGTWHFTG